MTSNVSDLVKVNPLDLSTVLKHAFLSGVVAARNTPAHEEINGPKLWTDYEPYEPGSYSRILADLSPAEQCFEVREEYVVRTILRYDLEGETNLIHAVPVPLTEALTIRSAEEVRREALEEAKLACGWDEKTKAAIDHLIDTPQPSTDTTPSVAEAAKVLLEFTKDKAFQNVIDKVGEVKRRSFQGEFNCALRAIAAQTGGE